MADDDARRLAKRLYNRRKQREFRERLERRLSELRALVSTLEAELDRRKPQKNGSALLLPWADVASALASAAAEASRSHHHLRVHAERLETVYRTLHTWVHQPAIIHPACYAVHERRVFTSTRVGLAIDLNVRRLSCEWLLDRLYHNAEALLEAHGLPRGAPPSHATNAEFLFDVTDAGTHQYATARQHVLRTSLDHVASAYTLMGRDGDGDSSVALAGRRVLDPELIAMLADKNIVYSQSMYTRHGAPWRDNRLWRVYASPDSVVVVSQNVHDDPLNPVTPLQRFRYVIIAVDAIDGQRVRIRELKYCSQSFDATAFVPLPIEALQFGIDVRSVAAADAQQSALLECVHRDVTSFEASWARAFETALRRTQRERATRDTTQ
ncbi:hypothetical protein SPRG_14637 [Saprolegnia parasitica CBS 223.65]|uniref:BZIP domain-containing protein n=1 Tax=Saprolegnia parasitica (strain CBS 223.65) TaxID=695850 RepID=A0A067BPB8_SAPPC|nr:hypothetical protein SPRG_14637 [Saprolegnia parasitica CBS 223.65]KDO20098.1 hypothetical protein SPRG_14637 [Saprolegnia parasitica CBS 223.65]|eukprot:XP_012209201.1 hypothetical protein SPRG_14637 [Saprolegnia parasitica CBS 223.65]